MKAKESLESGMNYPYDSFDGAFDHEFESRPLEDWAHLASRGVIADYETGEESRTDSITSTKKRDLKSSIHWRRSFELLS